MADNVLGSVFSSADALKRRLYDLITNPVDYAAMMGGRLQESSEQSQALQNQAFADPRRPTRVTDEAALARLTDMIMGGPMGFAPAGITAYHGSPYLFRMFNPAKVGTGEGAQAYGVGSGYTAEARKVAEDYAQANRGRAAALSGEIDKLPKPAQMEVYKTLNRPEGFIKQTEILDITKRFPETKPIFESSKSYLYKGDIPDEILPKFLDWDKPLSQQTKEVQDAIGKDLIESVAKEVGVPADKLTGGQFYTRNYRSDTNLMPKGIDKSAEQMESDWLQSRGIAGIRYLDQGSRGQGKGTSNFIPFRPEDYKIQEINDIPLEEWIRRGLLD